MQEAQAFKTAVRDAEQNPPSQPNRGIGPR